MKEEAGRTLHISAATAAENSSKWKTHCLHYFARAERTVGVGGGVVMVTAIEVSDAGERMGG